MRDRRGCRGAYARLPEGERNGLLLVGLAGLRGGGEVSSSDDSLISLIAMILVMIAAFGLGLINCYGPCSWVSWEPVADMPGRCLPGMNR
jgi:hypothetical protein